MEKKKINQNMKEEEEKKKKTALETKIRKRVAAEEKAYRIVERFVDETVSEDFLKDAGQFITPSHYEDIVVERAITKLCGYPICKNLLTNVSKQKYHISTRTNKVYDITERKNFCSNQCYKSSKYFEKQISNTPVWSRENEPRVQFDLLSLDCKSGSSGQEVIGGKTEVMAEVTHLAKLDRYESKQKHKVSTDNKIQPQSEEDQRSNTENIILSNESSNRSEELSNELVTSGSPSTENSDLDFKQSGHKQSKTDSESKESLGTEVTKSASKCENSVQIDSLEVEGTKSAGQQEKYVGSENTKSTSLCSEQTDSHTNLNKKTVKCENLNTLELEDTKSASKPINIEQADNQAKIDYLMKLLDKRKHLLNKMAQIETVGVVRNDDKPQTEGSRTVTPDQSAREKNEKLEDQFHKSCKIKETESVKIGSSTEMEVSESNERRNMKHCQENLFESNGDDKSAHPLDLQVKSVQKSNVDHKLPDTESGHSLGLKQVKSKPAKQKLNTIEMICRSMKPWITTSSLKFLKISTEDSVGDDEGAGAMGVEARFGEPEKRLGIDTLVGESAAAGPGDHPQNPVPDYAALEKDIDNFNVKVKEFYKGSFTYKSENTEKQVNEDIPVYLPSIDSHNQMLIRRKIVMERFDKSMPDLLPPMKLSIQDVFSELRQLVATFSLDNKNILFKPAEWIIVSLVILKLLSKRNQKIAAAFQKPSCKSYLSVLFKGINETLESFENHVTALM